MLNESNNLEMKPKNLTPKSSPTERTAKWSMNPF